MSIVNEPLLPRGTEQGAPEMKSSVDFIAALVIIEYLTFGSMDKGLVAGLIESSAGEWMMIISLVFGGCCSFVVPATSS